MSNPFNNQPISAHDRAAAQVLGLSNQMYNQMVRKYTKAYDLVWNNPNATPDKIVASMGTNAVKIFESSAAMGQLLKNAGADVPTTMPTGWNFQANPDGSVTLTKI
jgi:hypothetical protein